MKSKIVQILALLFLLFSFQNCGQFLAQPAGNSQQKGQSTSDCQSPSEPVYNDATKNMIVGFSSDRAPAQVEDNVKYQITPSLPVGLQFDDQTGTISGAPTQVASTQVYTVTVTKSCGLSATATLNFAVLECGTGLGAQTFNAITSIQNFKVPTGVTSLCIKAWGADAGSGGGFTVSAVSVSPGDDLNIIVGGLASGPTGGYGGGGNGAVDNCKFLGAGGGGRSEVHLGNQVLMVAGGAGGTGLGDGYPGGIGGGLQGGRYAFGAGGGTQTAGGQPLTNIQNVKLGEAGSSGQGGAGGSGIAGYTPPGGIKDYIGCGGGGGGGYFGGAGGASTNPGSGGLSSGGGGSGYLMPGLQAGEMISGKDNFRSSRGNYNDPDYSLTKTQGIANPGLVIIKW